MGKLVVMNYNNSTVDVLDTPTDYVDEEYLELLGYTLDDIEWMSSPKIKITINPDET